MDSISGLLICANFTVLPAIFLSYFFLFKFYNSADIFSANGVHVVYQQNYPTFMIEYEQKEAEDAHIEDEEDVSDIEMYNEQYPKQIVEDATDIGQPEEKVQIEKEMEKVTENVGESKKFLRTKVKRRVNSKRGKCKIVTSMKRFSCVERMNPMGTIVTQGNWLNISE